MIGLLRNRTRPILLLATLVMATQINEQALAENASQALIARSLRTTQNDIKRATQELNTLRDQMAESRAPVAEKLQKLEREAADLRKTSRRTHQAEQQNQHTFHTLQQDVQILEEECRFIHTLLSEYRRSMETRLSAAEARLIREALVPIDAALAARDTWSGLPSAGQALLHLADQRNRVRAGGMIFDGKCLNAAGIEQDGQFVELGPLRYFKSTATDTAGITVTHPGSVLPSIYAGFTKEDRAAIDKLISGKNASLPADVTSGDALKIKAARQSLVGQVEKGGFVMIPILAIGLMATVLTVLKVIQLSRFGVQDPDSFHHVVHCIRENEIESAQEASAKMGYPLADIVSDGITYRDAPKEYIEEILHEHLLGYVPTLEKHLGTLAVLGGIAPLLGLLGTVTGMIHTFQLIQIFGTGNARLLSGGISEALVTTEFGLIIAIPVLLVHAFLSRRVRTMVGTLERSVIQFVNALNMEKLS